MRFDNLFLFLESEENQKTAITPADLFNPALWLNPDGLPASGSISTWLDSSGNGRNVTQATPANQPVVLANALNGFRGASFDGVNDFLRTFNFVPSTGNYSYFVVYAHPATATGRCILQNGADIAGFSYFLNNGLQRSPTHGGIANMNDGNAVANQFEIVSVVRTNTPSNLASLEVNGVNQSITLSTSNMNNPTFGITLGARQGDSFAQATIVEIIIHSNALTVSERASITNYLKNKYNL